MEERVGTAREGSIEERRQERMENMKGMETAIKKIAEAMAVSAGGAG